MALAKNLSRSASPSLVACWLRSLDPEYKDIELSTTCTTDIGRSKETKISDVFCSKTQLTLKVSIEEQFVLIKVNGSNTSGLNGFMLKNGGKVQGFHGDIIELLYGRYPYKIEFIPPPAKKIKKETITTTSEKATTSTFGFLNDNELDRNEEDGTWRSIDSEKLIIFTSTNAKGSEKIAGYDLDWTIVKTKSGNVFPKDMNDWEIMLPEIPGKLKKLHSEGYKICFFTNQGGIGNGKTILKDFKFRIKCILRRFRVPIQVFISTTNGIYRKPVPGMWNYLRDTVNDGIPISLEKSFFVGDAAGRPETKVPVKKKRDHSCVDRLFAMNIGIKFYTPEEHFQNKSPVEWIKPEYNPMEENTLKLFDPENCKIPSEKNEIIIMVGLPGSGKSFFVENYLKTVGYVVLNADTIGNVQKCLKKCEANIESQTNCVIDNTNVDVETRKKYLDLAKKNSTAVRCFIMNTSFAQIKHNLAFRHLTDIKHTKINDMVLNSLKKKFVQPSLAEGFDEIFRVNIVTKFKNTDKEKLYKMYL